MAQPIWTHPDGRPFNQFVRDNHQWCFVTWHSVSYRWSSWLKSLSEISSMQLIQHKISLAWCWSQNMLSSKSRDKIFMPEVFWPGFPCHDISCDNSVSFRLGSTVLFFTVSFSFWLKWSPPNHKMAYLHGQHFAIRPLSPPSPIPTPIKFCTETGHQKIRPAQDRVQKFPDKISALVVLLVATGKLDRLWHVMKWLQVGVQ